MEKYIVSARKYRPKSFGSVVGQESLTTTLKNAIQTGKLAHAYLFCGPRGVGKTTCARIFAKTINCLTPTAEYDACEQCESCKAFNEQRSYNIHELDAASNNSVEDIRALIDQVRIPPQIGKYKVFIIDEVHMLSQAAFNAFLKTLEEPPAHAIFILATTEKHKILPTILSRCQIYDFNRMGVPEMVNHLRYVAQSEGYTTDDEALNVIAQKADGGMRDALSIFDQVVSFTGGHVTYDKVIQNLNVLDQEYYFRLTDHLLQHQVPEAMMLLDDIISHGFEAGHFINGFANHLRDVMVSRDARTTSLLQTSDTFRQRYQEQATRCTDKFLYSAIRICNDCDMAYRTAKNKRLLVEVSLIRVAQLTPEGEDTVGAGRRPAKKLLPLFTQQTLATEAAIQTAPVSAQTTSQAEGLRAATPTVTPSATPAAPATPVRPTRRLGLSITTLAKQASSHLEGHASHAAATATASTTAPDAPHEPLEQQSLLRAWHFYANRLPAEKKAIAGRLVNHPPVIKSDDTFEVAVDNTQVQKYIQDEMVLLLPHLRQELKNAYLTPQYRILEKEEIKRPFTTRERFVNLIERSHAFRNLVTELKLEL